MKKLLVVDGNSILNRAFYGIRLLTNKEGIYTNAVYGMINIVAKQIERLSPDYCAVAFDVKAPTFRHEMFSEYKAGRHATPPELLSQIPYAKQAMSVLGASVLELAGYEADDILGTLAAMGDREGCQSFVLTGDRDSLQLISEGTTVLLATNTDTVTFDRPAFFEKYGVNPEQFVDVKALMGDSSDNIPGVAGVGEKTAIKLISQFESLEKLYASLPASTLTAGVNNKLENGRESAFMSQRLARICCEVPTIKELSEITYHGMDRAAAYRLFEQLEFSAFIKRFSLGEEDADTMPTTVDEEQIIPSASLSLPDLRAAILNVPHASVALTETGLAFFDGERRLLPAEDASALLGDADIAGRLICYDAKMLYKTFAEKGMSCAPVFHDIMLGAYVLDPSDSSFEFDRLCRKYIEKSPGGPDEVLIYRVFEAVAQKIAENKQEDLLYHIEMPLAGVLANMERLGFKVDTCGLTRYGKQLEEMEDQYKERIYYHAGCEFNVNSPKQLGEILFERLMLPGGKKTKTGYSTNAEILEKLKPYHPIIEDILDYRQVAKLRSTYTDGLVKVADEEGRIHTTFKQTGTATGRLSSTEPNLQNIPIRTELGRELRRFFISKNEEYVLLDADYSQIELRLLADIAGDEHMREAFIKGEDIHTSTAAKVFGVDAEQVTSELRKRAKAVNFGIVYGIGDFSLAADLGISRQQARTYIDSYLAGYPAIDAYLNDIKQTAYEKGYVTTIFGRRRYIPELSERNKNLRAFGERVAMNSPIQGTAADIIKIAMIRVDQRLRESGIDAKLILQVHDELLVEAHRDCADEALGILREEMENAVSLSVPLDVEVGMGDNWYECK